VTTTAFITPCWRSSPCRAPEAGARTGPGARAGFDVAWLVLRATLARLVLWVACLLAPLWPPAVLAQANEITTLRVERSPEGLLLTAQLRFELPPAVDEALQKGIPLFFVADAVLLRERWYWTDQEVAGASRHMRLSYQPLTRRWRVAVGSSASGQTGLALGQAFDSRDEALAAIQRISSWKIAEPGEADPEHRYTVNLRFRLDTSQLPRPFQIGVVGQPEWNLAAARSLRLDVAR